MPEIVRQELRRIARVRRGLGMELGALVAALLLAAYALHLGADARPETATILLLGAAGLAGGSLRFAAGLAGLLAERCPCCGQSFFVSLERLVWSLPFPRGCCAHCGVSLAPPAGPPAPDSASADRADSAPTDASHG